MRRDKNLLQIFELTKRDRRVVILIMTFLLVVTLVERYRSIRAEGKPFTSRTVSPAPSPAKDQAATANN
jgi:hypothetical protein